MLISHMNAVTESAPPASSARTIAAEGHRYAAFQRHIAACPACSSEQVDMCNQGYWLLIGALGIVANSPLLAV